MSDRPASPRQLGRVEWVRRCAVRIRALDDVVTLIDAADLATTLHDLPCCHDLTPEAAAARLFQDDLVPSQWQDLSVLCRPDPASPEGVNVLDVAAEPGGTSDRRPDAS